MTTKVTNNAAGKFDLLVIGGGAAGFYGAIQAAEMYPGLKVAILEKSSKLLSKVRVSGGGRCNVTHSCFDAAGLSKHYPRGRRELKPVFQQYQVRETLAWFASRRVTLKTEADGRMFPVTDSSQTIIDCFLSEARRLNIQIRTGAEVVAITPLGDQFEVSLSENEILRARRILISIGGSPNARAYELLRELGHTIRGPIPSLFTFNDQDKRFANLMGIAVPNAEVRIAGTSHRQTGPVLITHWGLSGPAVIRLSAWAAEFLHSVHYRFTALVNWTGETTEDDTRAYLLSRKQAAARQKIWGNPLFNLPQRLWEKFCVLAEIPEEKVWADASLRNINKLLEQLIRCPFQISGKTTFKEEFVTCGGVDLREVDVSTMESRKLKGIFFAGEVLDIDGETGGFNFQAAWSTAYVAAKNLF